MEAFGFAEGSWLSIAADTSTAAYFKEPKTYKDTPYSERAPFPNVVKICLRSVGIPISDVDRHVKAALKNLS